MKIRTGRFNLRRFSLILGFLFLGITTAALRGHYDRQKPLATSGKSPNAGTAVRTLPAVYHPPDSVTVSIAVSPDDAVNAYAVEEVPPAGWTVNAVGSGGVWDSLNSKVKWGPFFDHVARVLTYKVTPPNGETGTKSFVGLASFEGVEVPVSGHLSLSYGTLTTSTTSTTSTSTTSSSVPPGSSTTTLPPAPVVTQVSPNTGSTSQVTAVTIFGGNFYSGAQASIGSTPLTSVVIKSSFQITATVPAGLAVGIYSIRVCTAGRCGTLADSFAVTGVGPILQSIEPTQGFNNAPNEVLLHGQNFQSDVSATIGGVPLQNMSRIDASLLRASVPSGMAAGSYDVVARNGSFPQSSILAGGYTVQDFLSEDWFANPEDIWTTPSSVRQGDTITLGVNVNRQGGLSAQTVQVAFYKGNPSVDGILLGTAVSTLVPAGVGARGTAGLPWALQGITDSADIYVQVDANNAVVETSEQNNQARRVLAILPPAPDLSAPLVTGMAINGGAVLTANADVSVSLSAVDAGGSGVRNMLLIERAFNSAAREWVAAQRTGWIAYRSPYPLRLTSGGGLRYIQAWVADGAGNICSAPGEARINYIPLPDTVAEQQTRMFRWPLSAGQTLIATLLTLSGDADLYIWPPGSASPLLSDLSGIATDSLSLTASVGGDYQVEVFGYQHSQFQLTLTQGRAPTEAASNVGKAIGGGRAPSKAAPSQPVVSTGNTPAQNSAVPKAPLNGYALLLPLVMR